MKYLFIQAIDKLNNHLFKGCGSNSWVSLLKIIFDKKIFAIDYGGLGLIEKIYHIFHGEWPNIR
mgnify:CR=1 FL=1